MFPKKLKTRELPNSFYGQHHLDTKAKDTTRKENCKLVSVMNTDAKIPYKILTKIEFSRTSYSTVNE